MILKLILKLWPAITPILIYFFWIIAKRIAQHLAMKVLQKGARKIIDGEFFEVKKGEKKDEKEEEKIGDFSLQNRHFIIVLYLSFVAAIFCFLFFALQTPRMQENVKYIPPHMENGKVIQGKVIEIGN
ncbi:MAG: hypothetical protein ACJAW3_000408 [Lentimonas sp.]|jgi:hypothetical protein